MKGIPNMYAQIIYMYIYLPLKNVIALVTPLPIHCLCVCGDDLRIVLYAKLYKSMAIQLHTGIIF